MFGALCADEPGDALIEVAHEFSPRVAMTSRMPGEVVLDLAGLTRLFGCAVTIAEELQRAAETRRLRVRVAVAGTQTAARLLARHGAGLTVVARGREAAALAPLPVRALAALEPAEGTPNAPGEREDLVATFTRWGVRTLGALAALPADAVAARLGAAAVRWQRLARGEDPDPLVPLVPAERFEQALDLEWPIDGLEPLSFVLGRLLEPLSAHLERRGRGAAVLHVRLSLVTREVHERSLQLPIPMRDERTLRTLILLDLESHPPPAAIDRVRVAVDPTPARVVQFSLLARPQPAPEQVSTLMARLHALMGETRCGSPAVVDSWHPGAFAMKPFAPLRLAPEPGARSLRLAPEPGARSLRLAPEPGARSGQALRLAPEPGARSGQALRLASDPEARSLRLASDQEARSLRLASDQEARSGQAGVVLALRRFRIPVIARVRVAAGAPAHVSVDRAAGPGGRVAACAGPWRTSGAWWLDGPEVTTPAARGRWDRDEWDVTLDDGVTCRIFRDRATGTWFMEGIVD